LFAADAFAWKAEQVAARAAETGQENPEAQRTLGEGLNQEGLEVTGRDPSGLDRTGLDPLGVEQSPAIYSGSEPEPLAADETEAMPAESAAPEAASLDAETEAKRQARLRDRAVRGILRQLLAELIANYAADARGVEIREIAGGYRMATKPECHDAVRLFIKSLKPALKLSLPALETLAVIAYKQPVTAPEVNEIRGVESGGVLGSLLSRKLISTAGRKQVIGRPILYKTTKEFLLRFGLKDLAELPSMEEFEKMAAIELTEPNGEEPADPAEATADGGPEFDENAAEEETRDEEAPAEEMSAAEESAPATQPATAPANGESGPAETIAAEAPAETETYSHE
jgi:segregation and condensation protein B